jgi:NAD(P)H dehydrogenase (quinone)
MPAILKGWADRVLCMGFAYDQDGRWYDHGGLRGRRAMLSLTTGDPETCFTGRGIHGSMDSILWPIQRATLSHCGFQVLPPFIGYAVTRASGEERKTILERYEERLRNLDAVEPLAFHPLDHFGEGHQLKLEYQS